MRILLALCLAACTGCASSRWAMDDPDYREKYSEAYQPDEKLPRMLKQMADARFVHGKSGAYFGGAATEGPEAGGAEIGLLTYPASWVSSRLGLVGLVDSRTDKGYLGVNTGLRFQTPTRLAPFAGVGLFAGGRRYLATADHDGIDNNDNTFIDEPHEQAARYDTLATVYPELGAHFWLTGRLRLSSSVSYHVTTEGRDLDFTMFGVSLAWLSGGDKSGQATGEFTPLAEDELRQVGLNDDTEPLGSIEPAAFEAVLFPPDSDDSAADD